MTLHKLRAFVAAVGLGAAAALGGAGLFPAGTPPVLAAAAPVPKAAAEPADPLARVKPDNFAGLLWMEAVRKDLGLTADQLKKLDAARIDAKARWKERPPGGVELVAPPGGGPVQVKGRFEPNVLGDAGYEKAVAEAVTAEQFRRLKQLTLQAKGPAVLLDRRVIRALALTAEQEDAIEAALPPEYRPGVALPRVIVNGVPLNWGGEKPEVAWAAGLGVLTPEQRKRWDALVGKTLPPADLQVLGEFSPDEARELGGQALVPAVAPQAAPPMPPAVPPGKP